MGRWGAASALVLAGCAVSSEPRLDAIDPATVGLGVATPATLTGVDLHAAAQIDLDDDRPPTVERAWRVRIGDLPIPASDVTWRSPEQIDLVVPASLPVGVHDVV